MEDVMREEWSEKSAILRNELKVWEKAFAASNNGKKASRDDIKANPEIASKYKEYNRVRDVLSGKISEHIDPAAPQSQTPRKRKHEDDRTLGQGISKRLQIMKTPSKGSNRPWDVDPYESPSTIRNLFTPSKKALGPTPQKDGQVLGLFDLLQDDASPSNFSKSKKEGFNIPVQLTPRKPRPADHNSNHDQTSSRKESLANAFSTPLKNRNANAQEFKTPSSRTVSKLHFSTPSFLRRDNRMTQLPSLNEDGEDGALLSPDMARVPRKPLVRGLSAMLAGLRKMENDAADEDMDALREMEREEFGISSSRPASKGNTTQPSNASQITAKSRQDSGVQVEDSQQQSTGLLGGFDDEAAYDSAVSDSKNLDRDGQPLKIYKKKGQKRTTRKVNIKPTRTKPSNKRTPLESDSDVEGLTIPETQHDPPTIPFSNPEEGSQLEGRNFDTDDSQSEYTASDGGTRYRRPDQEKKKTKNRSANTDGRVKTAARKVTALAGQNFKRLKIRGNSGAKGGPGHGSRFRRKK